ncbi:hypothetical protein KI688_006602 [Linnemannia hyalina]|uniref:Uncharacterized protein n=1 Tax=Linnemannia hyalina TaxID=64524 RepID=A0A9P7XJ75_9FUNG|nr:hypothetical protein KI688_006602 [Linnemannia hyalina]
MSFFKSSKKQSTTVPAPALAHGPAPALAHGTAPASAHDPAPPPYSPQGPAQEKVPKQAPKMTEQEAFSSLINLAYGAPDKDMNLGSALAIF